MADLPGGASGLLDQTTRARSRQVGDPHRSRRWTRWSPNFSGHERKAAEEVERWKTGAEERKVIDATQAAITL
jgi:hypothetical protein